MRRSALPSVTRRVYRLELAVGLFLCAGHAQPKCRTAVEQPVESARWASEQQMANPNANVSDLRPLLGELVRFYPESSAKIQELANTGSTLTKTRVNLSKMISEDEEESVYARRGAQVFLCRSVAEAKAELARIRRGLAAVFNPFPPEKGTLGDAAFIRLHPMHSASVLYRRRNAVVYIAFRAPFRRSKPDHSRPYETIPDPTLEQKAITLAKTLDQLLISAK